MKFRMNTLCAAVGAALGSALAAPAFALPASDYALGNVTDVYISGASAQDQGLRAVVARLCVPGTMDRFDYGSNHTAFFCTAAAGAGVTTARLAVYKSAVAGSGNGVLPLLGTGSSLSFLSLSTIAASGVCTTSTVASVTVAGDALGVPSYTVRNCGTATNLTTTNVRPDGGLSDVEPPFFTAKDTSSLTRVSANSVTFGVIVSKNLYRALQRAQGLNFSTTTADTTLSSSVTGVASVPVNDNEANMPSLTRDVIASVFSGQFSDWSSLKVASGTSAVALTTFDGTDPAIGTSAAVSKPAPADTLAYVARRVPSSGTQKAAELFFFGGSTAVDDDGLGLGNGAPAYCNPTALGFDVSPAQPGADAESICSAGGQRVFNGSGTGNVRNCVANHWTGNRWAIGIASAESGYASGNNWRFIKIDGYAPSLLNVYTNKYKHWVSQSANKPAYFGSLSANKQNAVNNIFAGLSSQAVLKAVNATLPQVFGYGALFALQENGAVPDPLPVTQAQIQGNPGLPLTRALLGNTDNCQLPQYTSDTQVAP